jgi:hypothetical protein
MEELRQKGHNRESKIDMSREGKKYHFQKGGGMNIFWDQNIGP